MNERKRRWRPLRWLGRGIVFLVALIAVAVIVSALSNIGVTTRAADDRLTEGQRARAAESVHLRRHLGDRVWPGWGSLHIPQVVYNERHAFLVAYPEPPQDGWFREPAHEHLGGPWSRLTGEAAAGAPVYRQRLSDGTSPEAFTIRVGDRWTGSIPTLEWSRVLLGRQIRDQLPPVLEWLPPYRLIGKLFFRGPEHHVALTLHETFHAFQGTVAPDHFAAAENVMAREDAYPWDEPRMTAAWQDELNLLADAVESTDADGRLALARAFLDARSRRRELLSVELQDYERRREWLEGLAKYVEMEIWWAADTTRSYRPAAAAQATGLAEYTGASDAWDREVGQLRRSAGRGGTLFYYSGMAQARLLDRLGVTAWKQAAVPGGRFLEDLISDALDGGPSGL